ncbi:hypothetical protein [Entomomonas moraniae]
MFDGKEKLIALGCYLAVSLSYARELKQEVRTQGKRGIDTVFNRKI